jgi:hypothetical protein
MTEDKEKEQETKQEQQQEHKWNPKLVWTLVTCGIILFYLVSFGPFVGLICGVEAFSFFSPLGMLIYRPHYAVMYYSEGYYNYINWWAGFGDDEKPVTYEKYRQLYEDTFKQTDPEPRKRLRGNQEKGGR